MKEVVCFFLKGREFGVDVSQMKAISNSAPIEPREKLPDFVKGTVSMHGDDVPLVDIDQILRIPSTDAQGERKHLVFITEHGNFAVECDGISQIVMVEDSAIQRVPGYFNNSDTDYADCVIQKKDHSILLVINPDKLFTNEQAAQLEELIKEIEKERKEAERKRIEEERKRKEEEKRKREEEIARMEQESSGGKDEKKEVDKESDESSQDVSDADDVPGEVTEKGEETDNNDSIESGENENE